MAARLNKRCQDNVRDHIQAVLLVKRLQDHALGDVEMTQTQVRAADIVLKKVMPDQRETNVTGHITQTHQLISVSEARERIGELTERFGEDTDIQSTRPH